MPEFTTSPANQTVTFGDNATFTCAVMSLTTPNITWSSIFGPIFNQPTVTSNGNTHTSVLMLTKVDVFLAGTYTCNATNEGGSVSESASLTVDLPIPQVTMSPANQTVTFGDNTTFTCTVMSLAVSLISWSTTASNAISEQLAFTNNDNTYTSVLMLNTVNLNSSGTYTCSAVNIDGGSVLASATLTVNVPIPEFTISPANQTITFGDNTTFTCIVMSLTTPAITWSTTSSPSFFVTSNSSSGNTHTSVLMLNSVNLDSAGTYTCTAVNEGGSVVTSVLLTVNVPIPQVTTSLADQTITYGDDTNFTCIVMSLTTPNITWTTNASNAISDQPTVSSSDNTHTSVLMLNEVVLASAGTYTCTAVNEGGSVVTSAVLTVNVPSGVTVSPNSACLSYSSDHNLTCTVVSSTAPSISWSTIADIDLDMVTKITVTADSNMIYTSILSLTAVDLNYTGIYTCISTNEGGSANDSSNITVYIPVPVVTVSATTPSPVNYDSPLSLTCTVQSLVSVSSVVWSLNGSSVAVQQQPGFMLSGGAANTYTSVLEVANVRLNHTGEYVCTATNDGGEGANRISIVVVVPTPVILSLVNHSIVTVGLNATLNCTAAGFGLTYRWTTPFFNSDQGLVLGLDMPILTVVNLTMFTAGTYTCTVTDFTDATVSGTVLLQGRGPVILQSNNTINPTIVVVGENVFLQCIIQNQLDALQDLVVGWEQNGMVIFSNDSFIEIETSGEDNDRIVTSTLTMNPVNRLVFSIIARYTGRFRCFSYIGGFHNDRVTNFGALLTVHFAPYFNPQPASVIRINLGDTEVQIVCTPEGNPRAGVNITHHAPDGSVISYREDNILKLANVSRNNAGNYSCRGWNIIGTNITNFTVIVQDVPDQVTGVTVEIVSFFQVLVRWPVPSSNFGLNQRYNVSYGQLSSTITSISADSNQTDFSVSFNRNFSIAVQSCNDVGCGEFSSTVNFSSASPAMASLRSVQIPTPLVTSDSMFISWVLPPLVNPAEGFRAPTVTAFAIEITGGPSNPCNINNQCVRSRNELNATLTGLTANTRYAITVDVRYSEAISGVPVKLERKTRPAVPDDAPGNFTSTPTKNNVTFSWRRPTTPNGVIIQYNLTVVTSVTISYLINVPANQETVTEVVIFRPYQNYTATVTASTVIGYGPVAITEGRTLPDIPSSPNLVVLPVIISGITVALTVPVVNDTAINITWSPPTSPNGEITGYNTRVSTNAITSTDYVQYVPGRVSYTLIFGGLRTRIPYYISVGAVNQVGESSLATAIVFTKPETIVSVFPDNVNAQRSTDGTTVLISWEPVSLEVAQGFFVYHITLTSDGRQRQVDMRSIIVPFNDTSVNITDIDSQRTYTVTVNIAVLSEREELIEGPTTPPLEIISQVSPTGSNNTLVIPLVVVLLVIVFIVTVLIVLGVVIAVVYRKKKNKYDINELTVTANEGYGLVNISSTTAVTASGVQNEDDYEKMDDHIYEKLDDKDENPPADQATDIPVTNCPAYESTTFTAVPSSPQQQQQQEENSDNL